MPQSPALSQAPRLNLVRGLRAPHRAGGTARALRRLQCEVLGEVAAGRSLHQVAHLLCKHVERLAPEVICSILAVSEDGTLSTLGGPSLPETFARAFEGVKIGANVGSCGAAAFSGHAVETIDIENDPNWAPFREFPLAAGLRACWSSPIQGRDGRNLGAFAFYYRARRGPSALERRIVATSVDLCAVVIEHAALWSQLEQTNSRFDLALSHMSQGLCFFDGARRLIVANRRFSEMYGLGSDIIAPGTTLEQIVDMRIAAGAGPAMVPNDYLDWRGRVQIRHVPNDTIVELANGRTIAIHHRPTPGDGWVATHEDITERRRAEAQVAHMARHDALTGLPNRILFQERLDHAIAQAGRGQDCAVLCIDLDRFKAVNDTFGHPGGDTLLRGAAERLQACVREGDTVTRLGGDEFAILLLDIDGPGSASDVANRILHALAQPFDVEGHSAVVGASLGIAIAPHDGATPERLLKCADTALYRAKMERGAFRFFEPEMDIRLEARVALERDLRHAVKDEAFELAFQPMMDIETNRVSGFEALLRWNHPVRGQIQPGEFIPVAEETGLIVALGAWVLQTACAEAASWPPTVKLAVNLSAVQFRNKALVETVAEALAATGLPPARLELEITESVLLNNSDHTLQTLHALRALGVSVSLDDFGTGYSSLSYLRSFPFDRIKIDQSFIHDLSDEKDSVAITRAIVSLGRSLGIATTAEGVETHDQLDHLRREGCTEVQGYLFSRAVPAADVRLLLQSGAHVNGQGKTEPIPALLLPSLLQDGAGDGFAARRKQSV